MEGGALFILMNINVLDADWLLERLACLQVTKSWETTLSCHSKNVLYLFSELSIAENLFTGVLFKFAGCVTDAYRCCCMSLQSAGVSFLDMFISLIGMINGLVVYLCYVIGTQNTWNF